MIEGNVLRKTDFYRSDAKSPELKIQLLCQ